jgi:hypothetical protein
MQFLAGSRPWLRHLDLSSSQLLTLSGNMKNIAKSLVTDVLKDKVERHAKGDYTPITNTAWVQARLCKLQKRCTRLAAACDKFYQLLAYDQWFSPGILASSTTKTGRHDIAEILLKVVLKHQKSNKKLIFTIHAI